MEDRRSAFPGKDDYEPEHNILDGPHMRTESDPINVVHKRYWALLAVGVLLIGLFSFYAPVPMMTALHCGKGETAFVYTVLSDSAAVPIRDDAALAPLPAAAVEILRTRTTSHMLQADLTSGTGQAIVIYPAADTNYGLYVTAESAYVFACDRGKARYQVKDENGDLYQLLCASAGI